VRTAVSTVDPAVPATPGSGATLGADRDHGDPPAAMPELLSDPEPVRPTEPDAADCCGEGCIRCVYDRYDEALERYQLVLAAWRERRR